MFRIAFLICISFLTGCKEKTVLPYYNTPDFTPVFVKDQGELQKKIPHRIADFSFTDQHRRTITQADIEGKIHVANFFFTSCGSICPKMTNNLQKIADSYRSDPTVVLLSFSVTPWMDSIEQLKSYALNNNITSPHWHLLTGSKSEIYSLARRSYFAEEDLGYTRDSTEFLHTEHIILVDGSLRIRGIYNGTLPLEIRQLKEDIELLKAE